MSATSIDHHARTGDAPSVAGRLDPAHAVGRAAPAASCARRTALRRARARAAPATARPRQSTGAWSNVISMPRPMVTADVPSGSIMPTSTHRPLRRALAMANVASAPISRLSRRCDDGMADRRIDRRQRIDRYRRPGSRPGSLPPNDRHADSDQPPAWPQRVDQQAEQRQQHDRQRRDGACRSPRSATGACRVDAGPPDRARAAWSTAGRAPTPRRGWPG